MFPQRPVAMLWLPLILFFSVWSAHAKDDVPRISPTPFETPLFGVQYFQDSNVVLAREERGLLWRSSDAGAKWSLVEDIDQDEAEGKRGPILKVWMHPFDNERAYALSPGNKHWMTKDRGESWKQFSIPDDKVMPSGYRPELAFHAGNRHKVIFNGQKCISFNLCEETSFYTTNDFKDVEELNPNSRGCIWAHATSESHSERMSEDKDDDRIICVERGDDFEMATDNRLVMSDDFFASKSEPNMDRGRKVKGIVNVTVVKGYIITAAKAPGSSELSLFVTVDGETWHQGIFPEGHKVLEEEYTVLESTNYSIQIDVMNTNVINPMGVLFSSNSNGTYFTENIRHTNRSPFRIVDFEKLEGIQGIVLVNTVKNWQDVERDPFRSKQLESKISFDDGRSWKELKISDGDEKGERLHLHSVTEMSNTGRVFSSPAWGIVMGVGNTGEYLRPYEEGNVYVSDDAGLNWRRALVEPHKYEFGDQGTILVAVADKGPTVEMTYSLNHGKKWFDVKLDDAPISVALLTTVPDSTTQKFILEASKRVGSKTVFFLYAIDFSGIYDRQCEDKDFEPWWARLDDKGEPDCLMGRKQKYRRRKADAPCYIGKPFEEAQAEFENCDCTWEDYECDTNFKPKGAGKEKKCRPTPGTFNAPDDICNEGQKTFMGSSGFRKIPGNKCKGSVKEYEEEVERPCDQLDRKPAPDGKVKYEQQRFKGSGFGHKIYLEKASQRATGEDETIIMSTIDGSSGMVAAIHMSTNHGKSWDRILEDEENIQRIIQHPSENDRAFFLSPNSKEVIYTVNRGQSFEKFTVHAPMTADRSLAPLSFHPTKKDWFLWTGRVDCEFSSGGNCHNVVYWSEDRGADWKTLLRYSEKCEFITEQGRRGVEKLLYCVQHKDETPEGALELRSSDDFFGTSEIRANDVLTFATMSEFIIVAQRDPDSNLKVKASVDGTTFADAHFPKDFNVPIQTAYTLLDSSTHAVFLHVTVGSSEAFEYGRIMKSNSNGTSYVLSVDGVNRNYAGYVDFEKMQGVEGVAMVNVVTNVEEESSGKAKKLKSLITHNDGSEWLPIRAPDTDPDGKEWKNCDVSKVDKCSLHLHSYTERDDPRSTFSSPSAIGLMMGVGNVGASLGSINDNDNVYTFISRDAGISWKAVRKGRFKWEYGDQGSIIAIVEKGETNVGYYTLDEGDNWKEFQFNDGKVQVQDLSTVPSDNSKQFLIWVRHSNNELGTINVDFSDVRSARLCNIDEDNDHADDDYYLWSPRHPSQESDCLFGHTMKYHRKRPTADCWNGPKIDREQHGKKEDCACTAQDFECDYNYQRQKDRTCGLVPNYSPPNHKDQCAKNTSLISYHEETGYRKIPISTCVGGEEYKYLGKDEPCPGHDREYEDTHPAGLSGFPFFLVAICLPIAAAAGIGWWVWTRYQSGNFGAIRLGEGSRGVGSAFDADKPWVKYPIAVLSGLVAVVAAIPLLVGAGWRGLRGMFGGSSRRYTTRQSFARGRGDYAVVDPDEDELLGDEDEDGEA